MTEDGDAYENLLITVVFEDSLGALEPAATEDDLAGIFIALDDLDAEPTNFQNRLHSLDRELSSWWSLTPPEPANPSLRILVRPERIGLRGIWRVGPVTWHYIR